MDTSGFADGFDSTIDAVLGWVSDHGDRLFGPLRAGLEGFYGGVFWSLSTTPWFFVVAAFVALGWRLIGVRFGVLSGVALVFCAAMGLWPETMSTLALVATATAIALAFAIPLGILAGFGLGMLGIPWLYPTEINSLPMHTKGAAAAAMANWLTNFAVVEVTPVGLRTLGWRFYIVWTLTNAAFRSTSLASSSLLASTRHLQSKSSVPA